ncbi:hypothetical protein SAMN06296429_10667 [Janibacter indicus]|uniref:Uncharacterized protein n=1 Tax=Janibacter indicus TaxID=857417 RepID=A0A1W2ANX4_9MICO|nr:hypothetical protein SAMN06296429_10667 [Janibacter indicus]
MWWIGPPRSDSHDPAPPQRSELSRAISSSGRRKVVKITALGESELKRTRAARAKLDERLFAHNPRRKQEIMAELNELSDRWAELAAELAAAED